MSERALELLHPPIVEAILDIDCDLPPGYDLVALETPANELLKDTYPHHDQQILQEHRIEAKLSVPEATLSTRRALQALRFYQEDRTQLVQLRGLGYSFNRLAPYTALDAYLTEVERTWRLYLQLARPTQVRQVRLRYVNRILLPMPGDSLDLDDYLKLGPRLADEKNLQLSGFFSQYSAVEKATGLEVKVALTPQPVENGKLPIIFDNSAVSAQPADPEDWGELRGTIMALRNLKNRVFRDTLTEKCLELFQTP